MRRLVYGITWVLCTALLACGGSSSSSGNPSPGVSTSQSGPQVAATGTSAQTATRQPRGDLRIGADFLPVNFDPTKSFNLLRFGLGETLTRLTPDLKPQPWLAESVTNVDSLTWRVTLRQKATFHDGSPVDAEAVAASFRRVWELNSGAGGIIAKDTTVTVINPTTVEFKTARPDGAFMHNLAAFQFIVHKVSGDQVLLTGPYKPVKLTPDESLTSEAYGGHWGGPPPIAKISTRLIRDTNARVLALQAGDLDLLVGLPLEMVNGLSADFERPVIAGLRVQYVTFNLSRAPFNERAVREAFSLGIDRNVLNKAGFDGQGQVVTGIFPKTGVLESVAIQNTDAARARQVLDSAGWTVGADGVRAKDGRRLSVLLYSYPQRADLTPMALSIQAQLKPLGFDIKVEQTQDITKTLASGDFDAAMYSLGMAPTGDPLYAISQTLWTNGAFNYGKYSNTQFDATVDRLRGELDAGKRQALSKEAQELLRVDVPNAYLVTSPLAYAYRKGKVQGLTLHPNDIYMIDTNLSVVP